MKKFESRDTMPEPSGIPKPGDEEAETEEMLFWIGIKTEL